MQLEYDFLASSSFPNSSNDLALAQIATETSFIAQFENISFFSDLLYLLPVKGSLILFLLKL